MREVIRRMREQSKAQAAGRVRVRVKLANQAKTWRLLSKLWGRRRRQGVENQSPRTTRKTNNNNNKASRPRKARNPSNTPPQTTNTLNGSPSSLSFMTGLLITTLFGPLSLAGQHFSLQGFHHLLYASGLQLLWS